MRADRVRRFALTAANGGIAPPPAQHGKPATVSNWGCECKPCSTSYAAYHLDYSRTHPRK